MATHNSIAEKAKEGKISMVIDARIQKCKTLHEFVKMFDCSL